MDKKLIDKISIIGLALLNNGAEIYRVEESIKKMLIAYGYEQNEVFAIPSFMSISVTTSSDDVYTVSKRSMSSVINLDKIYELNNLIRYICNNKPDYNYICSELNKITNIIPNNKLVFLGYGMTCGFFTLFFKGNIVETIVGFVIGFLLYFIDIYLKKYQINMIINTIIKSAVIAFISLTFFKLKIVTNLDSLTIGSLMILVPGVAITNSLRDIVSSDYVSGVSRIAEAIIIAISIAIGVGFIYSLMGVIA